MGVIERVVVVVDEGMGVIERVGSE